MSYNLSNYKEIVIAKKNDVVVDEIVMAKLMDIGIESLLEENDCIKAYIKSDIYETIKKDIDELLKDYEHNIYVIEHNNWNKLWEDEIEPIYFDTFLGIRTHFHPPIKNTNYEIIITPKMSFGTGHHATTYLMISLMQNIDFKKKKILDVGSGTGILAILAEKLGAIDITALDNDANAIANIKENISLNECSNINIKQTNDYVLIQNVDVVLCNIHLNYILHNLTHCYDSIKHNKDGVILLSGFFEKDVNNIMQHELLLTGKLKITQHLAKNNWACLQLQCV